MQNVKWDDLRVFLAVARNGRLAAAGRSTGIDHTTVARRVAALERAVGTQLLDRSPQGSTLTSAGIALVSYVERMEAELHEARQSIGGADAKASGVVRLSTPEAFGTFLVAPNIAELHRIHPDLRLELVPESQHVQLANRDVDLAILLERPTKGPIVARRLTTYTLGLFSSRDYMAQHEPIASPDGLSDHPFAWYIDDLIDIPELRALHEVVADAKIVFRSTSIAAQQAAVAGGIGLGLLHVFAARQSDNLVRILPGQVDVTRSYWLAMHKDQQRLPRVRAVIEFLENLVALNRDAL